jgi:hypothetical protein
VPEITVSSANYAAVFKAIETDRIKRVRGSLLEAAMEGAETVVVPAAIKAGKDTGGLESSIEAKRFEGGVAIVVDAPHAGVIEGGSRPHFPPMQPLIDWVRRHAEGAFDLSKPKGRRPTIGVARTARAQRSKERRVAAHNELEAKVEAIARGIQRKIGAHGTPPHWFMRDSLPKLREILKATVERNLER